MKENKKRGIGLSFAWNGVKQAFVYERNFRIHLLVAVIVILLGCLCRISPIEWLTLTMIIVIVLALELVNSVCERIIDYVKPEIHEEAMLIKDMAAGAVFIVAIGSIVIGCIIFIPKLMAL